VVAARRSVREFTEQPLTDAEISQLLWATHGITDSQGLRTVPSAGALYPLELYLAMARGLYHHDPVRHELHQRDTSDLRQQLCRAALVQEAVAAAPAVFVMTAVYPRTTVRYGARGERYVCIEVGHAAQNLLLEAVALQLGAVPIGAFDDDQVSKVLQLPGDESPLYLIPVGHPR
jgi:SagB-type dehydrogenase family enzyme